VRTDGVLLLVQGDALTAGEFLGVQVLCARLNSTAFAVDVPLHAPASVSVPVPLPVHVSILGLVSSTVHSAELKPDSLAIVPVAQVLRIEARVPHHYHLRELRPSAVK
jgi:hypothetical protein